MSIRDRFTAFIDRHEIAWELGMGFLAVIYVAAGFALDDPAMVTQPLLPLLESALTVIFVTEFVAESPPRGIELDTSVAIGSTCSRCSRSHAACGSRACSAC